MDSATLSFSNQALEERFCTEELADLRRRRGLGAFGQDAGRLFGVVAGSGRRIATNKFPKGNALPLIVLIVLQLVEWRLHYTKKGSWRLRLGMSVIVSTLTQLYLMRLTYVFVEPLTTKQPLGVAAFYLAGSGIALVNLAALSCLVPYEWTLLHLSILTLMLIDPVHGFCAAQPHVRAPVAAFWRVIYGYTTPVDIDEVRICTRVTRVALVLFGFVASTLGVYRTQLTRRTTFLATVNPGQRTGGVHSCPVEPTPSIMNALPGLLPPLTVFGFYIASKDLVEL